MNKNDETLKDAGYRYMVVFTDECTVEASKVAVNATKAFKSLKRAVAYKYREWQKIEDGYMQPKVIELCSREIVG